MNTFLVLSLAFSSFFQGEGPFAWTSSFLRKFFFGGIGYWLIFFLLAVFSLIWLMLISQRKQVDATAWRFAAVVCLITAMPALLFKLTVFEHQVVDYFSLEEEIDRLELYQPDGWIDEVARLESDLDNLFPPLTGLLEPIMYLTILSGLGGLGTAISFYVTFRWEDAEPELPEDRYVPPPPGYQQPGGSGQSGGGFSGARKPPPDSDKIFANAWLVATGGGRTYQLYEGSTKIGRSSSCDIQLSDSKVSSEHARFIQQANGRFKLVDLGSLNGTYVNDKRVKEMVLEPNDKIRFGDNITVTFKS